MAAKKMENYKPSRNPLLAEETARSQKAKVLLRKKPPKRTLIGGHFVLMEDMCTARRTDVLARTKKKEEKEARDREREAELRMEQVTLRENNQNDSARLSTNREKLEAAMRYANEAAHGEVEEIPSISGRSTGKSFGRTPRPQSAAPSYRSSGRANPEVNTPTSNDRVEAYFQAARETARSSARSIRSVRPQSAASTYRSDVSRTEKDGEKVRPSTARFSKSKKMTRSSTLKVGASRG